MFPDEFLTDAKLTNPSQNDDGFPEGCTGYTQSELCQDEDHRIYDPAFTYEKTLMMDNLPPGSPCDIRTSLKSTIVYGVKNDTETEQDALTHRRGNYFNVQKTTDWYDGIKQAIYTGGRSVSVGTPWFWGDRPPAVLTAPAKYTWNGYPGHNWKICGWKKYKGVEFLVGKAWTGRSTGDQGFVYISREIINPLMNMPYTGAFTVAVATNHDIQTINWTLREQILKYIYAVASLFSKIVVRTDPTDPTT